MNLKALVRATFLVLRSLRRNGLDQTLDGTEKVCLQSDFWFGECKRLYGEAKAAEARGDLDAYGKIRKQHQAAIQRFKKEVCAPMDELTGVPNSIAEL